MLLKKTDIEKFVGVPTEEAELKLFFNKLVSIEAMIRAYTNNDFVNKGTWTTTTIENGIPATISPLISDGDSVMVKNSFIERPYVFKDGKLEGIPKMKMDARVGKVDYPFDVVQGAINLANYDMKLGDKAGIKSESISRYSVSYYEVNSVNNVMGYPLNLIGFLKPYMKARF